MEAQNITQLEQELNRSEQPVLDRKSTMLGFLQEKPVPYLEWQSKFGVPGKDYTFPELRSYGIRFHGNRKQDAWVHLENEVHQKFLEEKKRSAETKPIPFASKRLLEDKIDREKLYQTVNSGTYTGNELAEMFGVRRTAMYHHLSVLESEERIGHVKVGLSKWYYSKQRGISGRSEAAIHGLWQSESVRRISHLLVERPGIIVADLSDNLNISAGTADHHIKKMLALDLIELQRKNSRNQYYPKEKLKQLVTAQPSKSPQPQ